MKITFFIMFKKNNKNKFAGMIALFPAIIISSLLLVSITFASQSFLAMLWQAEMSDQKTQSVLVANSCLQRVFARIIQNSAYAGGEVIKVGDYDCTIEPITNVGANLKINVSVEIDRAKSIGSATYSLTTGAVMEETAF